MPRLIAIPSSDTAFGRHVGRIQPETTSAAELEQRLRRIFPRVVVRERSLSGEAAAWYVYRDGRWQAPHAQRWWDENGLPRVRVSKEGFLTEASRTAAGILGIDPADVGSHHFTDFIVPGTLDDAVALFRVVEEGSDLTATVLLRPLTGDVIAVDLYTARDGDDVVGIMRLAEDVDVEPEAVKVDVPESVESRPRTDVAFRGYVLRALGRMPEPTAEGLAIRLRRLYPHALVRVEDEGWLALRDGEATSEAAPAWWRDQDLPRVRYDGDAFILEANDAAREFFGRELEGHHWQEFVTAGSTDQVGIMLEILAEVGEAESRFRMPRGDGTLVEFDSYTVVEDGQFTTTIRAAGPIAPPVA